MSSKALADGVDVGTVVANTYVIVSILGRGGMGTVWEAHHKRLPGKRVAIKVLHPAVAEDVDALARFRREAEIACRLGHPNIVEVHDFNSLDDGTPYLVLELLEGQSLDARLKEGQLSLELCEQILRQVSSALQCAHEQGVIHRDLKPQNIFLVPSPTGVGPEIAKVLDFGISKIRGSQTVKTQESTLLGTPQYMAPEQATGQHDDVDARTDLFALAVMLYELLSGRAAFAGQTIPEVVYKVVHVDPEPISSYLPGLPAAKANALHKAMSKTQDERFGSIAEFVEAFTGTPLAATRLRLTPAPSELAEASTLASTKLAAGSAATIDSQKLHTPVGSRVLDIASAATIDSQKVARDKALAATIDSSKMERQSTLMAVQPAQPASTQSASVVNQPRTVPLRTLFIVMGLMLGVAATLWILTSDAAKERTDSDSSIAALAADTGSTTASPDQPQLAGREKVDDDQAKPPLAARSGDSADDAAEEVDDDQAKPPLAARSGDSADDAAEGTADDAAEETADDASGDSTPSGDADTQHKSVTPKPQQSKDTAVAPPAPNNPQKAEAIKLLARAREELARDDNDAAIATASLAYRHFKLLETFEIKVMASCRKSDISNANGAMRNISRKNRSLRKKLQSYCEKRNVNLDMKIYRRD